ncbi:hypothetical protein LINPERHAP2_LOCUS16781 [Linum perenne]
MKQKNGACSELSDASKLFKFLDKSAPKLSTNDHHLRFCMGLSGVAGTAPSSELTECCRRVNISSTADPQPSLQLALFPFSPIPRRPTTPATKAPSSEPLRFPWLAADPAPRSSDCTKSNLRFWKKASKNTTLLT